jgi:hypothetical protein
VLSLDPRHPATEQRLGAHLVELREAIIVRRHDVCSIGCVSLRNDTRRATDVAP